MTAPGARRSVNVRQLERRTVAVSAASTGRAIDIAGAVQDKRRIRLVPVWAITEVIQYLLCPTSTAVWYQLENRAIAIAVITASAGRTVKIAGSIKDQAAASGD